MGNCLFGGMTDEEGGKRIQVVTANGGIMEFNSPVTAGFIIEEYPYPCHAIFKSDDLFWKPLSNHQLLHPGDSYLLLPLHSTDKDAFEFKVGHVRSKSIPTILTTTNAGVAPYRMSFHTNSQNNNNNVLKRSNTDVFSRYRTTNSQGGVWKVKLVISPDQLLDILSQETRTQELIQSVRTVAKCGGCSTGAASSSSTGFLDQWSIASTSSKASSQNH